MEAKSMVEIRPSAIDGKGVFANRAFSKGETVLAWDISNLLSEEDFSHIPETEQRYVAKLGTKLILMQPPARYVNHSCDPNTIPAEPGRDVALRDIAAGEEITSNYAGGATGHEIDCRCNSEKCAGKVIL